ncbi:MAG: carboxypeptidase regulatory-like domain-containing protein [Gemmatimonadaceae bacterium]
MQHLDEGTIHAWLDGELPLDERELVEAHVAACDECKAAVAEARGFMAASSRILTALDLVPGGVLPATTSIARPRAPRRFAISRAWMAAAAVLVLSTATVIAVRPKREAAVMATAPEPAQSGKAVASNGPIARAPSDQMDASQKKVERKPMIVAQAPAAPAPAALAAPASERPQTPVAASPVAKDAAENSSATAGRMSDAVSTRREAATNVGIPITGRVVSESGAPLGSASVQVEGTGIVTLTHDDGRYALVVPAARADGKTKSLVARLIGYKAATAPIAPAGDSIAQDFVLRANPLAFHELVVTGEGTNGQRSGVFLANGTFAELASRTSSGESGEPVEISLYHVGGRYITFIDRLRPDTTRGTFQDPAVTMMEEKYDKQGATINRLAWTDSEGRMRTLRGAVSVETLQQLKRALDHPTP